MVQHSHPYMTTVKTIAWTRWTFVGKLMSLLFNMLSRLVTAFPPGSKCLLISWLQSPSAMILDPRKIKSLTISIVSPSIWHKVMELDAMILAFCMLSFKQTFLFYSFTFNKWIISSSLLSAITVVSSAYLRLLIFLLTMLLPACASSSLAFHIMYSSYKLNRVTIYSRMWSFSYLELVCCSMSSSNCCFLTCTQISQEAGQLVWYSHLLKNFPVCFEPHSQRL